MIGGDREPQVLKPLSRPLGRPVRLGVLISGGGRSLLNLVDRIADGRLDARVAIVIANRDCVGVERSREAGLVTEVIRRSEFDDVAPFSEAVFGPLRDAGVDLVVLAGFLSLLKVPEDYRLRVLNIHPSLIPSFCGPGFYGDRVHEAVLEYGAKVSGCTVHLADDTYDTGPVVLQRSVPVLDEDTTDSLAARVFEAECEAYPEAIRLFGEGRLEIRGRRVHSTPPPG